MAERITVIGNIGRMPVLRTTPKGEVLDFTVAHTARVQDETGAWKDGDTVWYRVSVWDRLGVNAGRSLQRGHRVIVHGDASTHRWVGDDDVERSELRIKAVAVGHDLAWGTSEFKKGGSGQRSAAATSSEPPAGEHRPEERQPAEQQPRQQPGDWGAPAPSDVTAAASSWATGTRATEDVETPF